MSIQTADLCDKYEDAVQVVEPIGFRHFGGRTAFSGKIATIKAFEDNSLVRSTLETAGEGQVLVVDGGGSMRCAMVGDQLALLAVKNGWAGIVVFGCIRDSAAIGEMPVGVMALGTNPRKSVKRNSGERGLPLRFAGTTFSEGSYLYADADGIIVSASPLDLS